MQVTILTVQDDNGLHTTLHAGRSTALSSLRKNYAPDKGVDDAGLVQHLTDKQGLSILIEEQWTPNPEHDEQDKAVIELARAEHQRDGEVEIDDSAIISYSDDGGAYVGAWVWVTLDEVHEDGGDEASQGGGN